MDNVDAPPSIHFPDGHKFNHDWEILRKLDEGGFGSVYEVRNRTDGTLAALKVESNDQEGGSAIKLEIAILKAMEDRGKQAGQRSYAPVIYHAAKRKRFCYMIMTLLGKNLQYLKLAQRGDRFSVSTWVRLAIQGLYALKQLHDCGFLHRDVKPANFAMGAGADNCRLLHLLDFGLARSFAYSVNGNWVARRARANAQFRGTVRYCSPTAHESLEQGRKDDIWSFMFVVIEMHNPLPWAHDRDCDKLAKRKVHISDSELLRNFPTELHPIIPHLRSLNVYQRPDYAGYHGAMQRLMVNRGFRWTDPYDWETETTCRDNLAKQPQQQPPHENPTAFFAADPLRINGPPPASQVDKNQHTRESKQEKPSTGRGKGGTAPRPTPNESPKPTTAKPIEPSPSGGGPSFTSKYLA